MSIRCSSPSSSAGTELYTRFASQSAPFFLALIIAAECPPAVRRRMPHGVGETEPGGAAVDRRAVERLEGFGFGPRGVFGHVHPRQTVLHGEGDGVGGRAQHSLERPVLGILADGRRADGGRGLERGAHLRCDPYDPFHIGYNSPGGTG